VCRERVESERRLTSHFDGDSETLHHFVATDSDQVKTDNLLFRSSTDHLHSGRLLVIGVHHRVVEGSERSFVNLDLVISILLARFRFSLLIRYTMR